MFEGKLLGLKLRQRDKAQRANWLSHELIAPEASISCLGVEESPQVLPTS